MIDYGRVRGATRPLEIDFTPANVFVASNITEFVDTIDDREVTGYEYDYKSYTKDEYVAHQAQLVSSLEEQLQATKILLGVE